MEWITSIPFSPITHVVAIICILLWKFPRSAIAFDRITRRPSFAALSTKHEPFDKPATKILTQSTADDFSAASSDLVVEETQKRVPVLKENVLVAAAVVSSRNTAEQLQHAQQPAPPEMEEPSEHMKEKAPSSTKAERYRFLAARNGNEKKALVNLQKCLEWRLAHAHHVKEQEEKFQHLLTETYKSKNSTGGFCNDKRDLYDWTVASQAALCKNYPEGNGTKVLPRIVTNVVCRKSGNEARDLRGQRILHIFPAQIDDDICSLETYALAIALYLDRKADRYSLEKTTLTLDLRPGKGWKNISGMKLIPFIKAIIKLLLTIFPERLYKCIIYPLPFALKWIFAAVKVVVDPDTAKKLVVLSGGANMDSPLPLKQMMEHVSEEVAYLFEKVRLEAFKLQDGDDPGLYLIL